MLAVLVVRAAMAALVASADWGVPVVPAVMPVQVVMVGLRSPRPVPDPLPSSTRAHCAVAQVVHRVRLALRESMAEMVQTVRMALTALREAMALMVQPMRVTAVTVATVLRHWMLPRTEAMVALAVAVATLDRSAMLVLAAEAARVGPAMWGLRVKRVPMAATAVPAETAAMVA